MKMKTGRTVAATNRRTDEELRETRRPEEGLAGESGRIGLQPFFLAVTFVNVNYTLKHYIYVLKHK